MHKIQVDAERVMNMSTFELGVPIIHHVFFVLHTMGKTKGKAPVKTMGVPSSSVGTSAGTSTSSSASANSYQNLIRTLLSIPEGASEERTDTLNKLAVEYKALVSSNMLNALKDKYLAEELQDIQLKYNEAATDYGRTKDEHDALNNKYIKLKQLSQQLTDRTKQSDLKAAAALNAEQQKRVKLTESFSGSIAKISAKLDSLTSRRESVVTENINLKAVLKSYLEEFDADQRSQQNDATEGAEATKVDAQEQGEKTDQESVATEGADTSNVEKVSAQAAVSESATAADETEASAVPTVIPAVDPAAVAAEAAAPMVDPIVAAEKERNAQAERVAEAANLEAMEAAEDITRLAQLRATEHELRLKSAKYSELFDGFQSKLSGCNTGFQTKQSSIEALSKEMVALEKENAVIGKRVADCVMSTKVCYNSIRFSFFLLVSLITITPFACFIDQSAQVMMKMHSNTQSEAQKQAKVVERYSALIDLLQKEIDASAK